MIALLTGRLAFKTPTHLALDVQGVGYEVFIPLSTYYGLPNLNEMASLSIHTHVREDQIALYGFLRLSEKRLFEKLLTVSGIGPKLAITILSGMAADEMVGAIRANDVARLTRIPGIGRKTAERMVLELRDKLAPPTTGQETTAPAINLVEEDVLSALMNLGYQRSMAEKSLAAAVKAGKGGSFDALFRETLGSLSK